MRKFIIGVLLLFTTTCYAGEVKPNYRNLVYRPAAHKNLQYQTTYRSFPPGLSFYKEYQRDGNLSASYVLGDANFSYSATSNKVSYDSVGTIGVVSITGDSTVIKYPIANNRTAAQETIVISFVPLVNANTIVSNAYLCATQTKLRDIVISQALDDVFFRPNATDSATAIMRSGVGLNPLINNVYTVAGVAISPTNNPNSSFYINNTAYDSTTQLNTDWTIPIWGLSFWLGSDDSGALQSNSIFKKVEIYNRPLSASEVANL